MNWSQCTNCLFHAWACDVAPDTTLCETCARQAGHTERARVTSSIPFQQHGERMQMFTGPCFCVPKGLPIDEKQQHLREQRKRGSAALKRHRREKQMTQLQLANTLGVEPSRISNWETAKTTITPVFAAKLACVFNTKMDDFR